MLDIQNIVLRSEQEIISQWNKKYDIPLVSIMCLAYNHEKYIEDALKGFLIQETGFPFEVLIHDDASTDRTADIIREYEKRYPHIIKPIYQKKNQWLRDRSVIRRAQYGRVKGKYIAICEGDDYWVDKNKLQIQVDYLDKHLEVSVSSHDAVIVDDKGKIVKKSKIPDANKKDHSCDELIISNANILSTGMLFRSIPILDIPEINMVTNGDSFLLSVLGNYGRSHYHGDILPAIYRVHSGGVWSMKSQEQKSEMSMLTFYWLYKYYERIGKNMYAESYKKRYEEIFLSNMSVRRLVNKVILRSLRVREIKKGLRSILRKVNTK